MESIRYHRVNHPFPTRQVEYDAPSPLHELRSRLASTAENDDVLMEESLTRRLEQLFLARTGGNGRRKTKIVRFAPSRDAAPCRQPQNALLPDAPGWPAYVARFLVHFVKGIFFGAGMFSMDRLLATHRLRHFLDWLYKRLFNAADSVTDSGSRLLID